jgi:hypothetical protein
MAAKAVAAREKGVRRERFTWTAAQDRRFAQRKAANATAHAPDALEFPQF